MDVSSSKTSFKTKNLAKWKRFSWFPVHLKLILQRNVMDGDALDILEERRPKSREFPVLRWAYEQSCALSFDLQKMMRFFSKHEKKNVILRTLDFRQLKTICLVQHDIVQNDVKVYAVLSGKQIVRPRRTFVEKIGKLCRYTLSAIILTCYFKHLHSSNVNLYVWITHKMIRMGVLKCMRSYSH